MYCCVCKASVEDVGGSKLDGCSHFICTDCLINAVKNTERLGIKCSAVAGRHKCGGQIMHEDLEYLVTIEVYQDYLARMSQMANSKCESFTPRTTTTLDDLQLGAEEKETGWAHKACYIDEMVRFKGCSRKRALRRLEKLSIVYTKGIIACSVCMDDEVPIGNGVVLNECDHMFCKDCLANMIEHNEEAIVKCPYIDGNYTCIYNLQEREIKELVTDEVYNKFLEKSLKLGESGMESTFHCKTPDCPGWCVYDFGVNNFNCPVCKKSNCISCKAIHDGSCADYKNSIQQSENDKLSEEALEELILKGEYMRCSKCNIPVQKVAGCDWLRCSCCRTELCWATKGARWGPNGYGDTSGGCRCRINNVPCHPRCGNCH